MRWSPLAALVAVLHFAQAARKWNDVDAHWLAVPLNLAIGISAALVAVALWRFERECRTETLSQDEEDKVTP